MTASLRTTSRARRVRLPWATHAGEIEAGLSLAAGGGGDADALVAGDGEVEGVAEGQRRRRRRRRLAVGQRDMEGQGGADEPAGSTNSRRWGHQVFLGSTQTGARG